MKEVILTPRLVNQLAADIAEFHCSYESADGEWPLRTLSFINDIQEILENLGVVIPEYCAGCYLKNKEMTSCVGDCEC